MLSVTADVQSRFFHSDCPKYPQKVPQTCVSLKEDILAPPPESDDVINDFDIEEEVIEVENRCVVGGASEARALVYLL